MKGDFVNLALSSSSVFISHMVQMKGCTGKTEILCEKLLYIPHGSDESSSWFRGGRRGKSLYPTWFR